MVQPEPIRERAATVVTAASIMETEHRCVHVNGIELSYQSFGPRDRETVLLLPGVGGAMHEGPDLLARELVARGYRVVTYDSRDAGASTHMDGAGVPDWKAIQAALETGDPPPVAYTLKDLAADAIGLLDALRIRSAHIVGGSLGGMVAQVIAAEHPGRTLSLTSISSSTGNPALAQGPAAALVGAADPEGDAEVVMQHRMSVARLLESPRWRADDTTVRARIAASMQRPRDADAEARQGVAAAVAGDRRARLRAITAPTVVVHGDADALFPVEHGRDTAASIPGATLHVIAGMGHDLPDTLVPVVADDIVAAATRAKGDRKR